MSKLTDEQIEDLYFDEFSISKLKGFARAIESAVTEPLLRRIAELESNEKVLLAQVQGHTKWREKIVKASEEAYGESAIRYKFSLAKTGKCMNTFPKEIDGRWFALVPAEDDGHIGHIARIAELEQRNRDLYEDVQRFRKHALNEKAARLELERQLEEARKQMEAQKAEWLAWEAKRKALEKAAESYQQLRNGNNWPAVFASHDAPEPLRGEELDAAMQKGQS